MPKKPSRTPKRSSARTRTVTMASRASQTGAGMAMPPTKGAPEAIYPLEVKPSQQALAPQPLNDRYPTVLGQSLNLSTISSAFRLATTGYRQQLVDILNELLEQDPHLYSVVWKRILSSANGRIEITAFELPEGHKDTQAAEDLADFVRSEIARIPDMVQAVATLLWGIYYGLTAAEIFWTRDADGWHVDRLGFIHTRRLAYPDAQSWSLHIWDQGQVFGWQGMWGQTPTNSSTFGLRVADYPGKFIVYAPQLRGDYPTREGIGREVAAWAMFKRVGVRNALEYLERFSKPFMDVSYTTQADGKPREADEDDIDLAKMLGGRIGPGSGSYSVHADSIKVEPKNYDGKGAGSKLSHQEWVQLCNAEMSKASLGGTLGTEVGRGGGNRSLGEVQERAEVDIEQYDATTLAQALKRDLVMWLVRLNRPAMIHLCPHIIVHVDTDPDPKSLVEVAKGLTAIGAPVDLEKLSDQTGVALVDKEEDDTKPRRSFMSFTLDPSLVDPNLMSEEAKQQAQDATDAAQKLAEAKAAQPQIVGGKPGETPPTTEKKPEGAKTKTSAPGDSKPAGKTAP